MAGKLARQFAIPWIVLVAMFVLGTLPVLAEDESADDDRNRLGIYLGVTTSGGEEGVSVGIGKGFEIAPGIAFDFTESENSVVVGAVFSKSF